MADFERFETLNEKYWKPEEGFFDEPGVSRSDDYCPWESTPISEQEWEVQEHQRAVDTMTYEMLQGGSYPHLTQQLEDYVSLIYFSREANRKTKNVQSYRNSLPLGPEGELNLPGDIITMNHRMIAGRAAPNEIRQVRKARKMGSAELAKLTHIYGYRLEHIDAMRADVLGEVEASGGVIHKNPVEEYSIIAADNAITHVNKLSFALTMTRVRHLATIGDAKDIERSSFIVLLNNQSRLDPDLIEKLKSVEIQGGPEDPSREPTAWVRSMMDFGLADEVKKHLDSNDFETIVPMSTTIFEYDPKVIAEIRSMPRTEESISSSELIKIARQDYIKSVGGIAMFNRHDSKEE